MGTVPRRSDEGLFAGRSDLILTWRPCAWRRATLPINQQPSWLGRKELVLAALERVLGSLQELQGRDPHSELRELLNNMVEDVGWHLNRVAVVVGNTRAVVDTIRDMEGLLHTFQVVAHLNINSGTTRGVDIQVVVHLNINRVIIRGVDIQLVVNLNINRVTIRDVVVHAPEVVEPRSHTMAGIGAVVADVMFLQVHPQEQFPSCTKPHMSNIKPRWFHHPHRELAHPLSLWQR